ELFGHQRGAFTGAIENRKGLVEDAHGGTLFVDEVDELPAPVQVMLLQTLQEQTFRRLGNNTERRSSFRLVSASNRPIEESLKHQNLRTDFYHRIAHVIVDIPPLRARREDITHLARAFLAAMVAHDRLEISGFSPDAQRKLLRHSWP